MHEDRDKDRERAIQYIAEEQNENECFGTYSFYLLLSITGQVVKGKLFSLSVHVEDLGTHIMLYHGLFNKPSLPGFTYNQKL